MTTPGVLAPVVEVRFGPDGMPTGASARALLPCPPARVWAVIEALERYPERVPMIDRMRRDGGRVTIDLRFKMAFFSVKFHCVVDIVIDPGRSLELSWVSGEPRDIRLRFEVEPAPGDDGKSMLRTDAQFDVYSVGWVAKYFLRHHPEIQYGIFPGVALALLDSIHRAAR
jgi:ribosome-associated toxin RatA of RatAB toxin-antitoxin module